MRFGQINGGLPKAFKSCPKYNKSPNMVTLLESNLTYNMHQSQFTTTLGNLQVNL